MAPTNRDRKYKLLIEKCCSLGITKNQKEIAKIMVELLEDVSMNDISESSEILLRIYIDAE